MGFTKMVNEIDSKEAARLGLQTRPLTTAVIQKHLEDVGIEPEFGTHSRMRGLSGGQKVKVVLAAAMWNNPHILVLDEPTNYLDRESLGALAGAIRNYGGGCLMISHNRGKHPRDLQNAHHDVDTCQGICKVPLLKMTLAQGIFQVLFLKLTHSRGHVSARK